MCEFCGMGEFFKMCKFDWNWFALILFSIENNQCFVSISECHKPGKISPRMCMISVPTDAIQNGNSDFEMDSDTTDESYKVKWWKFSFSSSGSVNIIWAYTFHKNDLLYHYCVIIIVYIHIGHWYKVREA